MSLNYAVTIGQVEAEDVDVQRRYTGYRTNTKWETDAAAVVASSNQALPRSCPNQASMLQSSRYSVSIRRSCASS